jgi:ClpP class serine protease
LISDIQGITGRPLVVYFASPYFRSEVRNEDIKRLQEVVAPFSNMHIDILIETDGGDPDAAEGIVSMLKSILEGFRAIVPLRAKSSGTLICLAADTIVMGPSSELGPIEPQINGIPASILKNSKVHATAEYAKHALRQTENVAKRLLNEGMMRSFRDEEIDETVNMLSKRSHSSDQKNGYYSHGAVIDHREAKDLNLCVEFMSSDDDLWQKLFLLHCFYAFDSNSRQASKFFEQEIFSAIVLGDDPPLDQT